VEEVFFHCAKAFLRSGLWQPETWEPEERVPRRAVIASQVEGAGPVEELDAYYGPSYAEGLY
jgi:predicted pyridoxine 5'-phosphate oxidase superfamily flavin-nucleotide-binding protein